MCHLKTHKVVFTCIIGILLVLVGIIFCIQHIFIDYSMSDEQLKKYCENYSAVIMADIDYADNNKLVFHFLGGMFVYDINENQIIRSFDLERLNCAPHQQGSNTIDVKVSEDGKIALITNNGPYEEIKDFQNYIINLKTGMVKTTDKIELENPFLGLRSTISVIDNPKGWYSVDCAIYKENKYYLSLEEYKIGKLILYNEHSGQIKKVYIFN